MIRGMQGMFHSSEADALRRFLLDKLPGGFTVQLYEPPCAKPSRDA
jgi:hypothetical protein